MAANRGCSNSYFTDLVVKEVEQVFDGQRQRGAAMRRAEDRLEEVALNGDPEVDLSQAGGYLVGRELELNGGEVSAAARRGIDEVGTRARQLDCLQD